LFTNAFGVNPFRETLGSSEKRRREALQSRSTNARATKQKHTR